MTFLCRLCRRKLSVPSKHFRRLDGFKKEDTNCDTPDIHLPSSQQNLIDLLNNKSLVCLIFPGNCLKAISQS